jgi:hypothetical protein
MGWRRFLSNKIPQISIIKWKEDPIENYEKCKSPTEKY